GLKDETGEPLQLKALLHASGQAAMTTLFLSNLKTGDAILSHYSLYGGTQELMTRVLAATGIEVIIVDMRDLNLVSETLYTNKHIK
ncbi:PLP-dependent transferase, partial [Parvimonas sp. D9]|uniref:PLP-dependent transferase n=1 Tax=Parvimonas sp. D9 TaxID=3110689 RepID=UPI002B494ADF